MQSRTKFTTPQILRMAPWVWVTALSLTLSACPEDCPKGEKGCACNEGACDDGLTCRDDKCETAAATCADGREGCPCYPNSTCDGDLLCTENVCATAPDPGTLGGSCGETQACLLHDGIQLLCHDGVCVLPEDCPAGSEGCACNNGHCQDSLECQQDLCVPVTLLDGITVANATVRACDVMFNLGNTGASKVVFDAAIVGKYRKDKDRMALSFTARQDQAFTGPIAQVTDASGSPVDISAVTPSTLRCYDRLGAVVDAPQVSLR